jgi:outer membrane protein assembly factor BamB
MSMSAMSGRRPSTGRAALWRSVRLPGVTEVYASPVGAADRVYITDRYGLTLVVSHSDTPRLLASNQLDDTFNASAAIGGRDLLLRGEKYLYCLANMD